MIVISLPPENLLYVFVYLYFLLSLSLSASCGGCSCALAEIHPSWSFSTIIDEGEVDRTVLDLGCVDNVARCHGVKVTVGRWFDGCRLEDAFGVRCALGRAVSGELWSSR